MRERFAAQLLAGPPARDPVAVAERLLAVQAQDLRGARLAVRARTTGLTVDDLDRTLTLDRSLVIGWLNRGTLHLVRSEDYAWLHALTTPQLTTGNARRLRQEGVTEAAADRGVAVVGRSLTNEGPLTRQELRERLRSAGVKTDGQALVHVLMLACLRGVALRGPMAGRDHAYALVHDWLGPLPPVERSTALAELARRFLRGHGPADDRDLAKLGRADTAGRARRIRGDRARNRPRSSHDRLRVAGTEAARPVGSAPARLALARACPRPAHNVGHRRGALSPVRTRRGPRRRNVEVRRRHA